jgi:hypothetical protein
MPENSETQAAAYAPWPSAAVKRLDTLAGRWTVEVYLPGNPPKEVGGETVFEWLGEGYFLVMRSEEGASEFPTSMAIIGCDGSLDEYTMLYYDSRGVSRVYEMSLDDEEWKLSRDESGFSQRFTGRFDDDGNTIKAYWEKSSDGVNWDLDFDMIYTRVDQTSVA